LHLEFRKGTRRQVGSVHPLTHLPYTDTANFLCPSPIASTGWTRSRPRGSVAARILFWTGSKLEGDLRRVEVDLRRGTRVLTTRVVDFDDKRTVNEAKGDLDLFVDDIWSSWSCSSRAATGGTRSRSWCSATSWRCCAGR
jgi:hypothetical protein